MAARKPSNGKDRFKSLYAHGFVRVAACAPRVVAANPNANASAINHFAQQAHAEGAAILLTPELSVSGYAIDDLILQDALLGSVEEALASLKRESAALTPIIVVGAPLRNGSAIYNCAVVIHRGRVLGVAPKSFLPNYREFYEKRHFASAVDAAETNIRLLGEDTPFGADIVFAANDLRDFVFHAEICEDFWSPTPPSTMAALAGANLLLNLSASNIVIGKAEDRAVLCDAQSRRTTSAYILAASGG